MAVQATDIPRGRLTRTSEGWREEVVYVISASSRVNAYTQCPVQYGDTHPDTTNLPGLKALDFQIDHVSEREGDYFLVRVIYREPDPINPFDEAPTGTPTAGTLQLGARTTPAVFTKSATGAQIIVTHDYNETDRDGTHTQGVEVEGFVPAVIARIERNETTNPKNRIDFVGKTNSDTFLGELAGKWLCHAVEAVSNDGGDTYAYAYEFEFRDDGWDATVVFIDETTGRPVNGLSTGTSLREYTIYGTATFGALNLT